MLNLKKLYSDYLSPNAQIKEKQPNETESSAYTGGRMLLLYFRKQP